MPKSEIVVEFLKVDQEGNQSNLGDVVMNPETKAIEFRGLPEMLVEDLQEGVQHPATGEMIKVEDGEAFMNILQLAFSGTYLRATAPQTIQVKVG